MLGHRGVAVIVVVAALVAGCSVASDSAPSPGGEGAEPSTRTGPVLTVGEALAELPASVGDPGAEFTMLVGDLARATELGGLSRPADPADAGEWVSYLNGAMVDGAPPPVYVPLAVPLAPSIPAALVEEDLGWSILDVDHFVSWTSWPLTTTVVAGNFDDQTLTGLPETRGISSAGTGPDLTGDLQQASPVRPQGIPVRMAVDDERLIASPLTPVVKDWRNGSQRTLADDPVLRDLAAVLDEAGAVSAVITSAKSLGQALPPQAVLDHLREESGSYPFAEFDTYAIGWTVEGDQPGFVVAYHTTGDADLAVDRIAARWEGIDYRGRDMSAFVEVTGIEADGDIVVVAGMPAPEKSGEVLMLKSEASDLPFVTGFDPSRAS
jgi:hypothetical protein